MNETKTNMSPYEIWRATNAENKHQYAKGKVSFIKGLIPELAVKLEVIDVLQTIRGRFGTHDLSRALNPEIKIDSPVKDESNGDWLKKTNMIGVNIRTIGNFFNLVKYVLTLSEAQNSIHILPIWEPGVVASLYGKTSWNINPEFFSEELRTVIPRLDSVEKQLQVVVNLIHLMGKTIGLDVIPHTDRFSEMVFLNPRFFEWVKRQEHNIICFDGPNAFEVEQIVWEYLWQNGPALGQEMWFSKEDFFNPEYPHLSEKAKLEVLFGNKENQHLRLNRRLALMQRLIDQGYETMPVTMAPPYRGLHLNAEDFIIDEMKNKWYNYQFDKPEGMSRVFGPLTRYKFYEPISQSSQELDFENPVTLAWKYIASHYAECQSIYNFDFMRGDMAHVQPRKNGVPAEISEYYDPLTFIKNYIKENVPYFAFFAETFLAPPDQMAYGDEPEHLEAIEAESSLGDLQASPVGSAEFMCKLVDYLALSETRRFAPNFTIITADKDDPRFDIFYKKANHLRFFVGLFLLEMPSYMSLGMECRNLHLERGKNEEYSKLYVFQITDEADTDKVTHGPFVWGKNYSQFFEFEKIKNLSDEILPHIAECQIKWLQKPTEEVLEMVWQYKEYIFMANLKPETLLKYKADKNWSLLYSSKDFDNEHECRVYIESPKV